MPHASSVLSQCINSLILAMRALCVQYRCFVLLALCYIISKFSQPTFISVSLSISLERFSIDGNRSVKLLINWLPGPPNPIVYSR